jgi:hypothetical protein
MTVQWAFSIVFGQIQGAGVNLCGDTCLAKVVKLGQI